MTNTKSVCTLFREGEPLQKIIFLRVWTDANPSKTYCQPPRKSSCRSTAEVTEQGTKNEKREEKHCSKMRDCSGCITSLEAALPTEITGPREGNIWTLTDMNGKHFKPVSSAKVCKENTALCTANSDLDCGPISSQQFLQNSNGFGFPGILFFYINTCVCLYLPKYIYI